MTQHHFPKEVHGITSMTVCQTREEIVPQTAGAKVEAVNKRELVDGIRQYEREEGWE